MNFRDLPLGTAVIFRLRPTMDLRHPRDAFRFQRRLETRKAPAKELSPLVDGPLAPEVEAPRLDDSAYLAPYSDLDEEKYERYESPESAHGVGRTFL